VKTIIDVYDLVIVRINEDINTICNLTNIEICPFKYVFFWT